MFSVLFSGCVFRVLRLKALGFLLLLKASGRLAGPIKSEEQLCWRAFKAFDRNLAGKDREMCLCLVS